MRFLKPLRVATNVPPQALLLTEGFIAGMWHGSWAVANEGVRSEGQEPEPPRAVLSSGPPSSPVELPVSLPPSTLFPLAAQHPGRRPPPAAAADRPGERPTWSAGLQGQRAERRARSCPAPERGARPRPPGRLPRPASATAARRARHVAGAARPRSSGGRGPGGRTQTYGPTPAGTSRAGCAARRGAWARRRPPGTGRPRLGARGDGAAAGGGPPWWPPLSPRGARDAAADVAPRAAGLHRRLAETPPPAPGPQPLRESEPEPGPEP